METSYIHYSPEVLEKVNISQDHDKADQDSLPEKEEISDVHDSVNVSCTFRTVNKNCTVSTREKFTSEPENSCCQAQAKEDCHCSYC